MDLLNLFPQAPFRNYHLGLCGYLLGHTKDELSPAGLCKIYQPHQTDEESLDLLATHLFALVRDAKLQEVYALETALLPVLKKIEARGIRVDKDRARALRDQWNDQTASLLQELNLSSFWNQSQIVGQLQTNNIAYPRTAKGNPSITKEFLAETDHPYCKALLRARTLDRASTYLTETLISALGRIYPKYYAFETPKGGSCAGRMASHSPNIQQTPSSDETGAAYRACLLPEADQWWIKADYSQQEPTLAVHYALLLDLPKAEEAAEYLKSGKKLYSFFSDICDLDYKTCKSLYLGIMYGMGLPRLAATMDVSEQKAQATLTQLNKAVPFMSLLSQAATKQATQRGYVRNTLW